MVAGGCERLHVSRKGNRFSILSESKVLGHNTENTTLLELPKEHSECAWKDMRTRQQARGVL